MSNASDITTPEKPITRQAFNRAADTYDEAAAMQKEVGRRLIERLGYIKHEPKMILDIGCSCGRFLEALQAQYPNAQVVGLDFAEKMLNRSQVSHPNALHICADMEALPLQTASIDLIFSNLTYQWYSDLQQLFTECLRVLSPNGLMIFSTLGPDTLGELRASWASVDNSHGHVNQFLDMHEYGDHLLNSGFQDPVMDAETLTYLYPNVKSLMKELKATGAYHQLPGRRISLTGKQRLTQMIEHYEQHFRHHEYPDKINVTYEVVYGLAWKTVQETYAQAHPRQHEIPFSLDQMRALLKAKLSDGERK